MTLIARLEKVRWKQPSKCVSFMKYNKAFSEGLFHIYIYSFSFFGRKVILQFCFKYRISITVL